MKNSLLVSLMGFFQVFLLTLLSPVQGYADESALQKAKKCQSKGGIWLDGNCVIDLEEDDKTVKEKEVPKPEQQGAIPSSKTFNEGQHLPMPPSQPTVSQSGFYLGLRYPFQSTKGGVTASQYTIPGTFYLPNADGTYEEYTYSFTGKGDLEFSKELGVTFGWQTLKPNGFGYSLAAVYDPKIKISAKEKTENSKASTITRISAQGLILYSIGGHADNYLFSPFIGINYPFTSEYVAGSNEVNIDKFSVDPATEFGLKMGFSKQLEIQLSYKETEVYLKLRESAPGTYYQRTASGKFSPISSIDFATESKLTFKEYTMQLNYLMGSKKPED